MSKGLEIHGLEKAFAKNPIVRGLDLEVTTGEIVALLGPSGCGKTTALRLVAGLERPDRGRIHIAGRTVFEDARVDVAPEARGLGMVFQSYAVWPHRSVLENVAYPLVLRRDPTAVASAREALARVRLAGFEDRTPSSLSGGQQQRVALARALAARPDLLLFDEPLSNLDAQLREDMRHEVRELVRRTGITSLYVTHDQGEAFAVSDRVAVVLGGRVAQIDRPEDLYRSPNDLAVAGFVGRMSVLSAVERVAEDAVSIAGRGPVRASFSASAIAPPWVATVRPEAVALTRPGQGGLPGRITRSTFLGDRRELVVETEAGPVRMDVSIDLGLGRGGGSGQGAEVGSAVELALASVRIFAR